MRQEFKQSLGETTASIQAGEHEPPEIESTEAPSNSPPRMTHSHCQHLADYMIIFMKEGKELTLHEDRTAPLITEVDFSFFMSPAINSPFHFKISFVLHNLSSFFQALQKICQASHIRSMADLLHADTIQQLEVALLGSPAAQILDLLSGQRVQNKPAPMTASI